jgi:phosphoglycolate phosphatase
MNYTHIVWDFNGTLLDDVETGIRAVNRMLAKRNLPVISDADDYRKIFCFPIREYYRALGFDFEAEPYEVLAPEWVANYRECEPYSHLQEGAVHWLKRFAQMGIHQVLLSATEYRMLCEQLNKWQIDRYFTEVYGLDNIHAHSKACLAAQFRQAHPKARPLLIGDTLHDKEAADAMGADCILFCGGHQSRARLATAGCPVFSDFEELVTYLNA